MRMWHLKNSEQQTQQHLSNIGGLPMLADGLALPKNSIGEAMTFFFQIGLPAGHRWEGLIVSLFCDTTHPSDDTFLPPLPLPLAGADLSTAFFSTYQTFF